MLALLLAAGCGLVVPPEDPVVSPEPDCSQERAQPPARKQTLAFLSTVDGFVRTYEVQPSGCWTALDVDEGLTDAGSLSVHPSGRFLYVNGRAEPGRTVIRSFRIDTARGALETLEDGPLGVSSFLSPGDVVATDKALYAFTGTVGPGTHGDFLRFALDPASGALDFRGRAYGPTLEPDSLAWLPSRSALYFYSVDLGHDPVSGLRVARTADDGSLSAVDQVASDWGQLAVDPSGRFLWFATGEGNPFFPVLDVYAIRPDGALTFSGTAPWGRRPPVVHPSGDVFYGLGTDHIDSHHVDAETGRPRLVASIPWRNGAATLAMDPGGTWLYAISVNEVRAFAVDSFGRLIEYGRVLDVGGVGVAFVRAP